MNRRSARHRPGFAATLAIVLLGLVGVALALLTSSIANDARRLRMERDQAQARQLLLAANALLRSTSDLTKPLPLPGSLRDDGATLSVSIQADSPEPVLRVTARVGRAEVHQRMTLSRDGQTLTLRSIELE